MTMLPVQKGIPVPSVNRAPKNPVRKFPVKSMQAGDVFFLPDRSTRQVSAYVSRITKDLPGKFTARHCWMVQTGTRDGKPLYKLAKEGDANAVEGTGVWRIE